MRICVFCGSSKGRDIYVEAGRHVGRTLAERGIEVVYGGASIGVMGAVADGALEAGGRVIGVLPRGLFDREVGHDGLTELHLVANLHERKAKMAELSDGFIALPGGAGTMEELFEVWTWAQLGLHEKPVGILDVGGYYGHLRTFLEHMAGEGFVHARYSEMLLVDTDLERLLARYADYRPPVQKWSEGR